jgi:hypothetical protein
MRFNIAEEKESRSINTEMLRLQRVRRFRGQGEKKGRRI